ncbi:MAG: hypothetical protein ACFCU7_00065 [Pleurocapsa sp.]
MKIKVTKEQKIIQEAFNVLLANLEPSKVMRFWAACQLGEGDYLQLKDRLFEEESVTSLYDKISAYEDSQQK